MCKKVLILICLMSCIALILSSCDSINKTIDDMNENDTTNTSSYSEDKDDSNEHTHNYSDWEVVKDATCAEKGICLRECLTCGNIERSDIKAKGHTTSNGLCEQCNEYIGNYDTSSAVDESTDESETPTEKEYCEFVCDYYNQYFDLSQMYITYSMEKHAYQVHLGTGFIDGYRYLSSDDITASYTMHETSFNDLYNTIVDLCLRFRDEAEFTYGYKTTIELLAPDDKETLFIVCDGEAIYCAYWNFVRHEQE